MPLNSSNNSKEKTFSQSLKIENENILCKDGFCRLPNQNESTIKSKTNIDFFDPV